jgi:xanthine dehydrogenase accessory factor
MSMPAWARPSDLAALREQAQAWLAAGTPTMLVEVVATQGSAPREAGARMLVTAHTEAGTVGGGHLEFLALATSRQSLALTDSHREATPFERHVALGPSLGQCCGGAVTLRYARLSPAHLLDWPSAPQLDLSWPDAWPQSAPVIQLHGAGHVGRAIVAALAARQQAVPTVQWVDERESAFPADPAWFAAHPHVERLATDSATAEVALAPPGALYLVLTHSHELDLRLVQAVLQRGDFVYCGLIGSRTKRARFRHRLIERGLSAEAFDRITCPIGDPDDDPAREPAALSACAKWPEVIAASVARQLARQLARVSCGMPTPA